VDMSRHSSDGWYAQSAREADIEYANRAKEAILKDLRIILKG
jgi:hypothetical protein